MVSSCINWNKSFTNKGYGKRKYKKKTWRAHRAAWDEVFGEIPKGMCVLHKCDNRACVNIEHLFLGTVKDNNLDMIQKGRNNLYGAKKLSWEDVDFIRNSNSSRVQLASKFNVTVGTITNIKKYHTWRGNPIGGVVQN